LFDCSNNENIKNLPEMPNLRKLDCSHTKIETLYGMPNLKYLHCAHSCVTNISNMPNLQFIDCSDNENELYFSDTLLNLRSLNCRYTHITKLPQMPELTYLDCRGTNITYFPYFPKLNFLYHDDLTINEYKKIISEREILVTLIMIQDHSDIHTHIFEKHSHNGFPMARLVKDMLFN
jgi:Leucine-rich repeat (LRR) protein